MPDRYEIEWAPVAQADVDEILEYIAARDCVEAAMHVYTKLMERIETLVSRPEHCRVPPELRKLGVSEYHELIASPYSAHCEHDRGLSPDGAPPPPRLRRTGKGRACVKRSHSTGGARSSSIILSGSVVGSLQLWSMHT